MYKTRIAAVVAFLEEEERRLLRRAQQNGDLVHLNCMQVLDVEAEDVQRRSVNKRGKEINRDPDKR
ncbi:hypothetical protein NQZ68_034585 [Dissostichus eleginoides]|nr:hypothetical protein NQZ68_034585 [Dissostichus eleginoides]